MANAVHPEAISRPDARAIGERQIRLVCGLVLFAYLVSHFINHALGNISLDAMSEGLHFHMAFWTSPLVTVLFYGAAVIHTGLGFWAVYQRRQFKSRNVELLQIALGLSVPLLVATHVISVRLASVIYGHEKNYPQVFFAYWITWPYKMWLMFAVLNIAWIHGCIGIYFWLRLKRWFAGAAPVLLAFAVLLPATAMLGLYQGGRTIVAQSVERAWRAENLSQAKVGTAAQQDTLDDITIAFVIGYAALFGVAVGARGVRSWREQRTETISLSYGNGTTIRVPKGLSVLEASLRNNVPHASICGGRARCSTCRIRVVGDCSELPAPSRREAFVLDRVGAGSDPAIRLACQLRPQTDISFVQIFAPQMNIAALHKSAAPRIGQERYLVAMFVDMRGSTKLAETRLPFDTVFIVNRFLGAVSQAVIACGGQPNQFVGDGELALFGLDTDPRTACRQALRAAAAIAANVAELNDFLRHDLREPVKFGIGIHAGDVIVGDIGYRDHIVFTALGDPVNVAARLQDMTKAHNAELIFSAEVREKAGVAPEGCPDQALAIRGRSEPMTVHILTQASALTALVEQAAAPA